MEQAGALSGAPVLFCVCLSSCSVCPRIHVTRHVPPPHIPFSFRVLGAIAGIDEGRFRIHKFCMPYLKSLTRSVSFRLLETACWIMACFFCLTSRAQPTDNPLLMPRLLPGQSTFVFSLYGSPGEVQELKDLITFMKEKGLGGGFDPGPGAGVQAAPLLTAIAEAGWPVVCYPPDGGRMQVKGGTSVLDPAGEYALRVLDRAGQFGAIQLGEWGYHFHRLTSDTNWWKAVLGDDYETQVQHYLIPAEQRGYARAPQTRRDCYEQLREYFYWHRQAKSGRLISVTGHSHYEAYAAEWGTAAIGLEVGENIRFTQSKFAFARGASRQWNLPWTVQVSPWFGPSVTTRGPLKKEGNITSGMDAGHSLSLYERMWLHAWFAGAAMVTPENSIRIFFEEARHPWPLTEQGRAAVRVHTFMQDHDRGNPYTPLLVVLDHMAGYAPYHARTWGVLERTPGDWEIFDLLERQLYFSSERFTYPDQAGNPEADYLHPTPQGEIADVMLNTVNGATMSRYPCLLLAGDMDFSPFFLFELEKAARAGSRILMHPRHAAVIGEATLNKLRAAGQLSVTSPERHAETERMTAVSSDTLAKLSREFLPIELSGDAIQYQVNRNAQGWVIELINNDGVYKTGDQPAKIYPQATASIRLKPRFRFQSAREWITRTTLKVDETGSIPLQIPPGETRFVAFEIK